MKGSQLDFWQEELDALPWSGRSPRALTRGHLSFIFKARAAKDERFFVDPGQGDLFAVAYKKSRRRFSPAAPLLVDPPRGG